ncbi:MAG TPA: type II toxin-antitoxin system RelE/ParE family toxin [Pirellulales bacterium]|nr:type II toxin-antitoxin system RelE/ParE family toxin [Pirellulales bacterium]
MPKKHRVEITVTAERDLYEIRDYIALDKPVAAQRWLLRIAKQIRSLKTMPLRHEVIPEAQEIGIEYRHMLLGPYRTIYRVEKERVIVVRVIHGARLLDPSFLFGSENT